MRYFAELSYDGTSYNGWQRQTNAPSVQDTIERVLSTILSAPTEITGAGRTDSGVHASYYVAHFDSPTQITDIETLTYKVNSMLPRDIAFRRIAAVGPNAHARYDALSRRYKYYIIRHKDPFRTKTAWFYHAELNIDKMNEAAAHLLTEEDFTTFGKLHSGNKTNICHVSDAFWQIADDTLIFTIRADRFLRNMVRAITGTLVDVGRGKISPADFREILRSHDLSRSSGSAPAAGLFLTDIIYPDDIYKKCTDEK